MDDFEDSWLTQSTDDTIHVNALKCLFKDDDLPGKSNGFKIPTSTYTIFWPDEPVISFCLRLSLSEQPFAVGKHHYGMFRYRHHCIENEEKYGEVGPPARVFRQRFPEYCSDITCYSTEEFPTRNHAINCRLFSFLALPVITYDEEAGCQHCVGVLECISSGNLNFPSANTGLSVLPQPKDPYFGFMSDDMLKCSMRGDMYLTQFDIGGALRFVRNAHQPPVIQVWVTCMCNDLRNKLYCNMRICSENVRYISEFRDHGRIHCYVKKGEGLVGSAYSENRPCFSRDSSQFRPCDYPFVHLTRSSSLGSCFVIPLKVVHPSLQPLFLEIFLPPHQDHNDGNPASVLESILSTLAVGFSKVGVDAGLKQDGDFVAEIGYQLNGEELICFNVKRMKIYTKRTCSIESSPTDSSREATAEEQVLLDISGEAQDLQNVQDTAAQQVTLEVLKPYPGEVIETDQITLGVLQPYFGNNIDAAAKELGVSRSTLKRRCREIGIKRWPWHKRNKVTHIQANPRLQQSITQNDATEKEAPHSQCRTENKEAADTHAASDSVPSSSKGDRIRQSHDMIGKATYGDDTVMFPLKSHSGITELRKELNKRFQLQDERYKIKYSYEDEWILIVCDLDLHLGMEMIKSSGKNTINLSILPLPTTS